MATKADARFGLERCVVWMWQKNLDSFVNVALVLL